VLPEEAGAARVRDSGPGGEVLSIPRVWRGLLVRHLSWLLFSISWSYRLALPLLKLGWLWPDLLPRRYVVIPLMPEVG
jgi:hypothetical protein